MIRRQVLDATTTHEGAPLVLALEGGYYVISVSKTRLMSNETYGSEQAMAVFARRELGPHPAPRILVGGLGMGFTLRAVLDNFSDAAEVTVAELLTAIVGYNRGVLADLAERPLDDPRVELFEGDVRLLLRKRQWDVILMDVDNGPEELTAMSNSALYSRKGIGQMARSVAPGGVLVVWSAFQSPSFEDELAQTGLSCRSENIRARWPLRKGPRHVLTIATRPK